MALENMTGMLRRARENGYAVGAFNILDYNSMRAVIEAAEELGAPVVVQTSVRTVVFWGVSAIAGWAEELAGKAGIPAALHLDHCREPEFMEKCIEAGWTSVMVDGSALPFGENLELSRRVMELAAPRGVSVEAELGAVGKAGESGAVPGGGTLLTDPDEAEIFCRELSPDCFAPAIGTAHGFYRGEPVIDFELLRTIAGRTGLPLALHGGTGLSDEVFRRCITLGCAKINISTELKRIFIDSFVEDASGKPGEYAPLDALGAQFEGIKEYGKGKIRLFGSAGAAG